MRVKALFATVHVLLLALPCAMTALTIAGLNVLNIQTTIETRLLILFAWKVLMDHFMIEKLTIMACAMEITAKEQGITDELLEDTFQKYT